MFLYDTKKPNSSMSCQMFYVSRLRGYRYLGIGEQEMREVKEQIYRKRSKVVCNLA